MEPCIGWGYRSRKDNYEGGKERPIVKYGDILRSSVQKRLNQLRCRLSCGPRWAQGIVLDAGAAVLRDVAMAISFGKKFANWLCGL